LDWNEAELWKLKNRLCQLGSSPYNLDSVHSSRTFYLSIVSVRCALVSVRRFTKSQKNDRHGKPLFRKKKEKERLKKQCISYTLMRWSEHCIANSTYRESEHCLANTLHLFLLEIAMLMFCNCRVQLNGLVLNLIIFNLTFRHLKSVVVSTKSPFLNKNLKKIYCTIFLKLF
jgi:hypothetical protein